MRRSPPLLLLLALPAVGCGDSHTDPDKPSSVRPSTGFAVFCRDNPSACRKPSAPSRSDSSRINSEAKTAPAAIATCRAATLRLSIASNRLNNFQGGVRDFLVRVRARGNPCALSGYPTVRFFDGEHPLRVRYSRGHDYIDHSVPQRVFVSDASRTFFEVGKFRCDQRTDATATTMTVRLPVAGSTPIRLKVQFPDNLTISSCRTFSGSRTDPGNLVNVGPVFSTRRAG